MLLATSQLTRHSVFYVSKPSSTIPLIILITPPVSLPVIASDVCNAPQPWRSEFQCWHSQVESEARQADDDASCRQDEARHPVNKCLVKCHFRSITLEEKQLIAYPDRMNNA